MSVNLKKGEKISLVKEGSGLKKVMVGLGWDEAQQTAKGWTVILLGEDGKLVSRNLKETCIFYGNQTHPSGAIAHQGDNLTGGGEGDDEQIMIDLSLIPGNIHRLVFVVNIYDANVRNQHFGMIRNAFIRLVDENNRSEICRFNLTEDYSGMTGMIVGEIYRHGSEWKFNAIGQGVADASRITKLVEKYI